MDGKALYRIGYGLYILTARDGEKDNGCVINTFMQVTSSEPATALIAVNKGNLTHDMIERTGRFNVSVLTKAAPFGLYRRFGYQSGRTADKFAGLEGLERSPNGIYYLSEDTGAYISCEVKGRIDMGTHTVFTAEVTGAEILSDGESVTYDYYQKNVKPAPAPAKKTGWRCRLCGYVYEGEEIQNEFVCTV